MKIYEFIWDGSGTDWVFAPTIQEAKDFYLKFTGCGDLETCKVTSIAKSKWNELYIIDPNETEPDDMDEVYDEDDYCNGYKIIESFSEYAERNTITDMIATTEY